MTARVRRAFASIGCWSLVVGCSLLLFACGGGNEPANNEPAGPKAADLTGESSESTFDPAKPAIDISEAPTEIHKGLASLLPSDKALDKDSVTYAGWDASNADLSAEEPEQAAIPALFAEYQSAGYETERDSDGEIERVLMEYPQNCKLFLIRAPERRAAEVIEENIRAKLLDKGFGRIEPVAFAQGLGDKTINIPRYARIDDAGEYDSVLVAYVKVIGDLVVYALESETPPKLDTGETRISRVSEGGGGSRVGGRLIALLYVRLENAS